MAMNGQTQDYWHHRVPTESARNYSKRLRERGSTTHINNTGPRPRLNINFRYILPGKLSLSGTDTYYQYCRAGVTALPDARAAETARAKCQHGRWFDAREVCRLVYGNHDHQQKLAFPVVTAAEAAAKKAAKKAAANKTTLSSNVQQYKQTTTKQPSIRAAFQQQSNSVGNRQNNRQTPHKKKTGSRQPTLFEMTAKKAKPS